MSSNLPPSGPPTPPSDPQSWQPSTGPGAGAGSQGEVLEQGGGQPVAAGSSSGGGGLRRGLFIGGGVLGAAAIGVGAWAAYSFISTGPQPAEALPADTLAYLSVDLDPSGGQKIEALRTLNKFPAFKDEVGIDTDDDIKKSLADKILEEAPCDGLTYGDDIEPWLGDRAAVAAVDTGGETPSAVVVLQVKDADQADAGLGKIRDCSDSEEQDTQVDDASGGWVIEGDWAVISDNEETAQKVVDAAADGTLADDEDFQHWTGEAGDAGVVTMYAGPSLGDYLADNAGELFGGFPFGGMGATDCAEAAVEPGTDPVYSDCGDGTSAGDTSTEGQLPEGFEDYLRDFGGMAGTVRFDDGAVELEFAGSSEQTTPFFSEAGANDVISTLPEDTAAAMGVGFADDWFTDLLDFYAPLIGGTEDVDAFLEQMSEETGLDLPEDIETLLGDAAALSVDSDIDPDALANSTDASEVPVAVKVKGDPDEIEAVLEKLRAQAPPEDVLVLDSDSEGDFVVVGPNADYRAKVLEDGDLGDNEVFQGVVREADEASAAVFVNIDELEGVVEEFASGDQELIDNLEPLSGFGISTWMDGDTAHSVVRVTTND